MGPSATGSLLGEPMGQTRFEQPDILWGDGSSPRPGHRSSAGLESVVIGAVKDLDMP
jgi:hypothetical protein